MTGIEVAHQGCAACVNASTGSRGMHSTYGSWLRDNVPYLEAEFCAMHTTVSGLPTYARYLLGMP